MQLGDRPGIEPTQVDQDLEDGQVLSVGGGLRVIHVPGHAAGQMAFIQPELSALFAGDAASNMIGLVYPPNFEDTEEGIRSLQKLAELEFDIGCFGHGDSLIGGASMAFHKKWGRL